MVHWHRVERDESVSSQSRESRPRSCGVVGLSNEVGQCILEVNGTILLGQIIEGNRLECWVMTHCQVLRFIPRTLTHRCGYVGKW